MRKTNHEKPFSSEIHFLKSMMHFLEMKNKDERVN